jgi:hypothetical protein
LSQTDHIFSSEQLQKKVRRPLVCLRVGPHKRSGNRGQFRAAAPCEPESAWWLLYPHHTKQPLTEIAASRILFLEPQVTTASFPFSAPKPHLLKAILVGGAIAGILDLTSALITIGPNVPRNIAAGLLGRGAVHGGAAPWILGVVLHFFIAYSAATVYCLASLRLAFLDDHWLVCGMFYGVAVFLVMNLIVLPLCAFHFAGPYQLHGLLQGLIVHMFIIGLPISFSLHRLGR